MLRRFRKKLQTSDWRPAENDFWWCPPKKPRVFRDYIVALDHFPKFWVVDEVHFLKKLLILVFKWCTYYIISWHIYIYHLQPYRYHCFHSTPTPPHKSPRNHPPKQTTTFYFHGPPPKKNPTKQHVFFAENLPPAPWPTSSQRVWWDQSPSNHVSSWCFLPQALPMSNQG